MYKESIKIEIKHMNDIKIITRRKFMYFIKCSLDIRFIFS